MNLARGSGGASDPPGPSSSPRAGPELLCSALIGAGVVTLAHLTSPTFFEGMDWQQLHLPAHHFAAAALREGRLPLWNPHVALGRPFLADMETGVFYPPNLLYLALAPTLAYALLSALHYALAAWGTRRLCLHLGAAEGPSWLCAVLFPASQALLSRLQSGQSHYVAALAYLPMLALLAARMVEKTSVGRVAALAAALALQFLCGHPQVPWLTWLGLAAFVLGTAGLGPARWKPTAVALAGLAVAVVAALALAGPTLLPFLELVEQGNRGARSLEASGRAPMGLFHWSSLVVPNGARRAFYWEHDLYTGACVLIGGVAGLLGSWRHPQVRGLVAMAATGALLASGPATPAFAAFYHLVPGTSAFRSHSRAAVLVVLALVCGLGLLLSRTTRARRAVPALALGLGLGLALLAGHQSLLPAGVPPTATVWRLVWLGSAAAALGASALASSNGAFRAAFLAVAALCVGDVALNVPPTKEAWRFPVRTHAERPLQEMLTRHGQLTPHTAPPRIAVPPTGVRENSGVLYGWSNFAGYQAVSLARVWEYTHAVLGLEPGPETTFVNEEIYDRGPFPYASMSLVAGVDPGSQRLAGRVDADPRVYVVNAAQAVPSGRDAIASMRGGHDFHESALVEPGFAAGLPEVPPAGAEASATLLAFDPERVLVESRSTAPGLLVLAEPWYPGWEAQVDGRDAACVPVNAWMRAVPVPPGRHRVTLRFRSRLLGWGAALSATTLLVLVWLPLRARAAGARGPA